MKTTDYYELAEQQQQQQQMIEAYDDNAQDYAYSEAATEGNNLVVSSPPHQIPLTA